MKPRVFTSTTTLASAPVQIGPTPEGAPPIESLMPEGLILTCTGGIFSVLDDEGNIVTMNPQPTTEIVFGVVPVLTDDGPRVGLMCSMDKGQPSAVLRAADFCDWADRLKHMADLVRLELQHFNATKGD